mmetsp:Transcript_24109/g.57310  ORF Transcript_24109/g.57310 Transcript_24109/m.57310 type:complete len:281 (+) Transcript_24109:764-1606(+)
MSGVTESLVARLTSALLWISKRASAAPLLCAAANSGVAPFTFGWFTLALFATSSDTISSLLLSTAMYSGELPALVVALTSAWPSSSSLATSGFPYSAATCSAVCPVLHCWLRSALAAMSAAAIELFPFIAAQCNAVQPIMSGRWTFAFACSKIATLSLLLFLTAIKRGESISGLPWDGWSMVCRGSMRWFRKASSVDNASTIVSLSPLLSSSSSPTLTGGCRAMKRMAAAKCGSSSIICSALSTQSFFIDSRLEPLKTVRKTILLCSSMIASPRHRMESK